MPSDSQTNLTLDMQEKLNTLKAPSLYYSEAAKKKAADAALILATSFVEVVLMVKRISPPLPRIDHQAVLLPHPVTCKVGERTGTSAVLFQCEKPKVGDCKPDS